MRRPFFNTMVSAAAGEKLPASQQISATRDARTQQRLRRDGMGKKQRIFPF